MNDVFIVAFSFMVTFCIFLALRHRANNIRRQKEIDELRAKLEQERKELSNLRMKNNIEKLSKIKVEKPTNNSSSYSGNSSNYSKNNDDYGTSRNLSEFSSSHSHSHSSSSSDYSSSSSDSYSGGGGDTGGGGSGGDW